MNVNRPPIGHKNTCTCRRCTARATWVADEAQHLTTDDVKRILIGFDGSRRRAEDIPTFTTTGQPHFQRAWGNRWITDDLMASIDQDIRDMAAAYAGPRWFYNAAGPVEADQTSDPDGTVVHVITTL